jgi:hypothetical protein
MGRSVALFPYLVIAAAGCSSSSSGTDQGPAGPTIVQACSDSAAARCNRIQACSATTLAQLYGDLATCPTRVKANCTSSLNAPQNGNNPPKVAACSAAIGGWGCDDFLIGANPPVACVQSTGPVAVGSPCYAFGQCQTGFCDQSSAACGACAAAPTAGQLCTGANQCGPGLSCASDGHCVVPVKLSATCSASVPCTPGGHCISGVCKAVDSTAAASQPCGDMGGKTVACTDGTCEKSVCVARVPAGQTCDLKNGPFCQQPALCIGGTCQTPMCATR